MDVHEGPEGDQPDERVLREELDGPQQRGLEEPQLLLDQARVDDEHEHGGHRGGAVVGGGVLDRGVLGEELGGEVVVGDGGVVGGEVVALEAERADPDLGGEVDDREGVEDRPAVAAAERGVGEDGHGGEGTERGVDGGDGDDAAGGLLPRAGHDVPRHADAVLGLQVQELRHRGGGRRAAATAATAAATTTTAA